VNAARGSSDRWALQIDPARFELQKHERRLWLLVALARVVNALRAAQAPLNSGSGDSPADQRTRFSSHFLTCALLCEGVPLLQRMAKCFQREPGFEKLRLIFKDPHVAALLAANLRPIRNTLVFHFDEDQVGVQLSNLCNLEPIFASGVGSTNLGVNYDLADLCAMGAFFGSDITAPDSSDALTDVLSRTAALSIRFTSEAEKFLFTTLENDGWKHESVDN
jgi:hypothetical protein